MGDNGGAHAGCYGARLLMCLILSNGFVCVCVCVNAVSISFQYVFYYLLREHMHTYPSAVGETYTLSCIDTQSTYLHGVTEKSRH